jgi:uncharacterized surface protein with fasciclin (FAS1) repeats
MKLISLPKSVRTIGVIVMLSATIGITTACSNEADKKVESTQTATPPTQTATPPTQAAAPSAPGTVVDIAAGDPSFSTLVTAVKAAGLAETLSGKGPFTVFAPTNEAFAALPKGTLENLLKPENRDALKKVLTYHVVAGDLTAKDLRSGKVATVEGSSVSIQVNNKSVSVNGAKVAKADIDAKNGVIHVIDRVLLPSNQ